MLRITHEEAVRVMSSKLTGRGVSAENAAMIADTIACISEDGVYTHGINRFKRLVLSIDHGLTDPAARPEREAGLGGFERWNGHQGIGILNAMACTDRAIELAREHGVACVSLRNTNHWFRAGQYGWRIAAAGMIGILFTNTKANMVYHGTLDRILGTTPIVVAVPRRDEPIVADLSLARYAYGKMESAQRAGRQMPAPAGLGPDDMPSTDPLTVMTEARLFPLGEYKGSALNLLLDLTASVTGLGNSACDVRELPGDEHAISQTFIVINSRSVNSAAAEDETADRIVAHLTGARPADGFGTPRYPGQNVLKIREENRRLGIPVEETVWEDIRALSDTPDPDAEGWLG